MFGNTQIETRESKIWISTGEKERKDCTLDPDDVFYPRKGKISTKFKRERSGNLKIQIGKMFKLMKLILLIKFNEKRQKTAQTISAKKSRICNNQLYQPKNPK